MKKLKQVNSKCFTLVELLIAIVIGSFVVAIIYNLIRGIASRGASKMSKHLYLQLEARRALTNIYNELQTGIEILFPPAGATLPFLVVRDCSNNLKILFLKKDKDLSKKNNKDVYLLYAINYDPLSSKASTPKEILRNIIKLHFTAHGYNNVVISGMIVEGNIKFSFLNQVCLRNFMAEEGDI